MRKILQYQGIHLLAYLLLGVLLYYAIRKFPEGQTTVWGLSTFEWFAFSWVFRGLFQFWVAFFWRVELHTGKITAWWGKSGFLIYRIGYVSFGILSFMAVIPLAFSTVQTISIPTVVLIPILVLATPLIIWGIFSAAFYLGVTRASGADHFDPVYRSETLEKRGMYKYFPNTLYAVVILSLYYPGLLWESAIGLIAAAIHHALVWVHYFCTEKPDLKEIYG